MADVDDADAAVAQPPDDVQQSAHVGVGEGGRRLVHDHHARVLRQRLGDFHALPIGDRQRRDFGVDVDMRAVEIVEQRARLRAHHAPVHAAERRARRVADEDVFGDGQLRKEQQLLIDDRDALGARVAGRGEMNDLVADANLARVRAMNAGHDLDQRRLAGAVLAEQRVDLAGAHVERHVAQHRDADEGLRNATERNQWTHLSALPARRSEKILLLSAPSVIKDVHK